MRRTGSKRKARQLALAEMDQKTPQWATLPKECRQQVVELLARMLSNDVSDAAEELADE
jgi:hypothetical protein